MKKIISILLALSVLFSLLLPVSAFADEELGTVSAKELENATKVITTAISELNGTFSEEEAASASSTFSSFLAFASGWSSVFTAVNATANFLKLVGIVKDSNSEALANITEQMQTISESINQMNRKLDNITSEMSKLRASSEFNARTEQAMMMQSGWNDFQYRYEEAGMEALMTQYSSMLLDGLQRWCVNKDGARTADDVDNSRIVLLYRLDDGKYVPTFSFENSVPDDFPTDGRYLILPAELLPQKLAWNVDTYRQSIQNYIADSIRAAVESEEFDGFECANFPEFTAEGAAGLTDELIAQVAKDAVNTLSYRIAGTEVNRGGSYFSLSVRDAFRNYASHLLSSGSGIDAALKTYFLTHSFEFEVADDIRAFCNEMSVKAATYGAFAINVLGMSPYITEAEKNEAVSAYCRCLNGIGEAKKNSLTGNKGYCYLTNTELYFTELQFTASGKVETKEDNAITAFRSGSGNAIKYNISGKWGSSNKFTKDALIGDDNMLLLAYTMRSNNVNMDFDYLQSNLCDWHLGDYGAIVTGYGAEEPMPKDCDAPLKVTRVIGDYFRDGSVVSLKNLPEDAESKYVFHRSIIKGSVYNPSTLSIDNKVLSGLAIYGENHWYWTDDEVAFLGSSPSQSSFYASADRNRQDYQYYFTYDYYQSVRYNCLVNKPASPSLASGDEYDPLGEYKELNDELKSEFRCPFEDVSRYDETYDAVLWSVQNGITKGVGNSLFAPLDLCTRAQIVTLLWRAAGSPVVDAELPFTDVEEDAYYTEAVRWAVSEGIAKGTGGDKFVPDAVCSRAEAVTFLARYAGIQDGTAVTEFSDVNETDYFAAAVKWAADEGITKGTGEATFSPKAYCTREQAVMFLYRLMAD